MDGLQTYTYAGSNPIVRVDSLGLDWEVDRQGRPRAIAKCNCGDRVEDLAEQINLTATEFKKWLQSEDGMALPASADSVIAQNRTFSVPNTGYINSGSNVWGLIKWGLYGYEQGLDGRWKREGLLVDKSAPTSSSLMAAQLRSRDIYKFAYTGHGIFGFLDPVGYGPRDTWLDWDTYTSFGIAEMHLIACETNVAAWEWSDNVSRNGFLRTVKGALSALSAALGWSNIIHEKGRR